MGWGDVWLLSGIGGWLGWRALLPVVLLSAVQGSIVGIVLLLLGRGPAEKERVAREAAAAAQADRAAPSGDRSDLPASAAGVKPDPSAAHADDDWVPPPHAVPFGPFLALAALEVLLVGDALGRAWSGALQRLVG